MINKPDMDRIEDEIRIFNRPSTRHSIEMFDYIKRLQEKETLLCTEIGEKAEALYHKDIKMESYKAHLEEITEAWHEFVQFMRDKYGEDFKWTCPHLSKIDKLIGS